MDIRAWTGGSAPADLSAVSEAEYSLVMRLYNAQIETFRSFWGDDPKDDTLKIYLNRARHDAHATLNQKENF